MHDVPNVNLLVKKCFNMNDVSSGKTVHGMIVKRGLDFSSYMMNNLLKCYVKTGLMKDASKLFDELPVRTMYSWNTVLSGYVTQGEMEEALRLFGEIPRRDSVSWNTMIAGYNRKGNFQKAIETFLEMLTDEIYPSPFTITSVLASCAATGALCVGTKIHSFAVKLELCGCVPVMNSLLNMYSKVGDYLTAKSVFNRMTQRDNSTENVMMSAHIRFGRLDLARAQFDRMGERNVVAWNTMIVGYSQNGFEINAVELFARMLIEHSLIPDRYTLASVLSACSNVGRFDLGKQIHSFILQSQSDCSVAVENALISLYAKAGDVEIARRIVEQNRFASIDVIALTSLLDGYSKCGDMMSAREVFDSLEDPDVVSWTAIIAGYAQNGLNLEAMKFFRKMIREGAKPNCYTLAAMLSVGSNVASVLHGKQVHARALRSEMFFPVSLTNALVNMYAKAGSIICARRVFTSMYNNKDTASWTSMIMALGQHGFGEEAIALFETMLSNRIRPDHIAYVGVLSACTHVGFVSQGKYYFDLMQKFHKIKPTRSHYACMVDLYGRSGLLHEAYNLIKEMPAEPDVIVWGSLLSSCRVHKNADLAEIAAERLLLIEPNNSGAYSSLANVYSACGRWEEAAKTRKLMRERGVKKDQGFSWIQVQNHVHTFGAEDSQHPRKAEIYMKMDWIWEEIKKMGFVPDTESVFHDLEVEAKDKILRYHSEKLAIAFGLLSNPENATLRIMKNLRVCNDCHTAIKFISKLSKRKIIVRDATRFHHFEGGVCSCNDYW